MKVIDSHIVIDSQLIDKSVLPLYYAVLFLLDYLHRCHLCHQSQKKIFNYKYLYYLSGQMHTYIYHDALY